MPQSSCVRAYIDVRIRVTAVFLSCSVDDNSQFLCCQIAICNGYTTGSINGDEYCPPMIDKTMAGFGDRKMSVSEEVPETLIHEH